MERKKLAVLVALTVSLPILSGCTESITDVSGFDMDTIDSIDSEREVAETAVVASADNPFYAVIATPVSLFYDKDGRQHVETLLVRHPEQPSDAVEEFMDQHVATYLEIRDGTPEQVSLDLSELWSESDAAVIIEDSPRGYELGIVIAPLASYLNIPVFVTDNTGNIRDRLEDLGVKYTFVCGDLGGHQQTWHFDTPEEINGFMIGFVNTTFGSVDYVTITNPLDVTNVTVLNETTYSFEHVTASVDILPANLINLGLGGILGLNEGAFGLDEFEVPAEYEYARLVIDLVNEDSEYVSEFGDDLIMLVYGPDEHEVVYTSTAAGIPETDAEGDILTDRVHYETIIYDNPGTYTASVLARRVATPNGRFTVDIKVQEIDSPLQPLMNNLSSLAPYLTAYRQGIVMANTSFAFAGDAETGVPGVVYAGTNEDLVEPNNEHVMTIHAKLNELLADIVGLDHGDLEALRNHFLENPLHIAIMADPTMVPMYYYFNPDSDLIGGVQLPSDFMYADIDPKPSDPENNTYSYWPVQENAVGRVTGYNAEDCSALIARTVFYEDIIAELGSWKNNATVQTGAGLEFQWIPILTPLANMITGNTEPTKWPTGESIFINWRLAADMAEGGGFDVATTHLLASQREGFSNVAQYSGRLNIPFPYFLQLISGDRVARGGDYQENSNLIFVFNHGIYFLYVSGDVLLDGREFPPVNWFSRLFGPLGIASGLSSKGAYAVRYVVNMDFGPSVIFVLSCITGRTDGLLPENCLSQAYLHAGVNCFIGATRVTADPGYLEPGLIFKGFGAKGFVKAALNLLLNGEYPDPHFGSVIANDFILDLQESDSTVGMALRNAKNAYLPKDANATFLWTPPLSEGNAWTLASFESGNFMTKKYVCLHEFTIYGDPAFNPYQPVNNG
jgi:hypothetical protein